VQLDANKGMYEVERMRVSTYTGCTYPDLSREENNNIPGANINTGSQADNAITRRKLHLFEEGYLDRTNLADFEAVDVTL
jgi:hypothetical protein